MSGKWRVPPWLWGEISYSPQLGEESSCFSSLSQTEGIADFVLGDLPGGPASDLLLVLIGIAGLYPEMMHMPRGFIHILP